MNVKTQKLPHFDATSWTYKEAGSTVTNSYTSSPISSIQTTISRGHGWNNSPKPKTDVGGNFSTHKVVSLSTSDSGSYKGSGYGYAYSGREYAINPYTAINETMDLCKPSSPITMDTLGAKAISYCIPTNPAADAGTFIGELKSGLPKLVGKELFKTKFKDHRTYGSEYLNVEFGWKPLVSDLMAFADATSKSEKILAQLHRDSGRNVRRKYSFRDEVTTGVGTYRNRLAATASGDSVYPYCYVSPTGGTLTISTTTEVKTWFSGCFTYHLDLGSSTMSKLSRQAAEARKLYGLELTPATVWNLAPWSWALDWEGNIGNVLHNVSRFSQDGLVMRYGYIMQQKTVTRSYSLSPTGRLDTAPATSLQLDITCQSKQRRRATPFGFGIDMQALTGRQLSILGALGIARSPRHL